MDNNGRNPLQLAQSKLKLIMQSAKSDTEDAVRVKMEIQQIIEMMLEYLQKKGQDVEAELLNEFANRLTLSQTPQEVWMNFYKVFSMISRGYGIVSVSVCLNNSIQTCRIDLKFYAQVLWANLGFKLENEQDMSIDWPVLAKNWGNFYENLAKISRQINKNGL